MAHANRPRPGRQSDGGRHAGRHERTPALRNQAFLIGRTRDPVRSSLEEDPLNLDAAFYRLPLRFDVARLREEALQFPDADWRPHPQGFKGNAAIALIAPNGRSGDGTRGVMQPTPALQRSPYMTRVIAAFDTVVGRSRLMRLGAGERVAPHCDIDYYWHHRVRVHVPIVTDPAVRMICDGVDVHMPAGEAWLLNTWKTHEVRNDSAIARIHLVFDTVGSASFWDLLGRSGDGDRVVPFDPAAETHLATENHNAPVVMHATELEALIAESLGDAQPAPALLADFEQSARRCTREWRAVWAQHAADESGWPMYRLLQEKLLTLARSIPGTVRVRSNDQRLSRVLETRIAAALNTGLASSRE